LDDYSELTTDDEIILALKEGLKEAQGLLRILNMAPFIVVCEKCWFLNPWTVEAEDPSHWSYIPPPKPTACDDGDGEVIRDAVFGEIGYERAVSTGDEDIEIETEETGMHCIEPFDDGLKCP
jgi:hypothetical protein